MCLAVVAGLQDHAHHDDRTPFHETTTALCNGSFPTKRTLALKRPSAAATLAAASAVVPAMLDTRPATSDMRAS